MNAKRSSPLPQAAYEALQEMLPVHQALDTPKQVGNVIRIRR